MASPLPSQNLPIEKLQSLFKRLSDDDKEKVLLLTGVPVQLFGHDSHHDLVTSIEYWMEVLYVIQRYDLLKFLHLSKEHASEQVEVRTFFPIERRLLVKIYDAIPVTKEVEFDLRIRNEIAQQDGIGLVSQTLRQNLMKCESFLCAEGSTAFIKLKKVLESMDLTEAVAELDRFCECNKIISAKLTFYPMDRSPCGICLIINNKNIKHEPTREGSEIDVGLLKDAFKKFDFIVQDYQNLNNDDMHGVLKCVAENDHSNYCAFVCCIMSHGENGVIYSSDGHKTKIHDIRMMFCKCKTLIGKPKIFFYQACRGDNFQSVSEPFQSDGPSGYTIEDSQKDCLTGMATVEGNAAFRHPKNGSCFIQSLVEGLSTAETLSAAQILINAKIAKLQFPVNSSQKVGQTSEWVSTLTRDVKFNRNKAVA